jgi:lysozyme
MGQGLRSGRFPSVAGTLYYLDAPRLNIPQGLFWSEVDVADVSFWQGDVDFDRMKSSGVRGVFIRAGQHTWVDKQFEANWQKAKNARLPRGSYWFYDSRVKPETQADLYSELVKGDDGELPLVADFEETFRGKYVGWHNLYSFIARLQRNIRNKPVWIYTGYWYWMAYGPMRNPAALNYFSRFPLWIAAYTSDPQRVRIPKPWKDAALWQWGTPVEGRQRGAQSAEIDMNKFTGTLEEFETLAKE